MVGPRAARNIFSPLAKSPWRRYIKAKTFIIYNVVRWFSPKARLTESKASSSWATIILYSSRFSSATVRLSRLIIIFEWSSPSFNLTLRTCRRIDINLLSFFNYFNATTRLFIIKSVVRCPSSRICFTGASAFWFIIIVSLNYPWATRTEINKFMFSIITELEAPRVARRLFKIF
jgi:hypothetical protein